MQVIIFVKQWKDYVVIGVILIILSVLFYIW